VLFNVYKIVYNKEMYFASHKIIQLKAIAVEVQTAVHIEIDLDFAAIRLF
jgi:hypothetical protein